MNQIGTLHFNFTMQDQEFARNLYGRWDSFFANCVEREAEQQLQITNYELGIKEQELIIDKLELDLGSILEDELNEQFAIRFREKLKEELSQLIVKNEELRIKNPNKTSLSTKETFHSPFSILCGFLLNGSLPWSTQSKYKNISQLFLQVLQTHAQELKHFLYTYGHYTSLQQRLVYQLNQPELEAGVNLLAPAESTFIIRYVRLLQQKYKQIEKPVTPQTEHRIVVWKVVYSYLLTNRSSYFNKKSFVAHTIGKLATEYNTNYAALLQVLTLELTLFSENNSVLPELFQLLGDLKKELDQDQFETSAKSAAKLYKNLLLYFQKQINKTIDEQSIDAIINMLSKPRSCREFLQLLTQEEIIRLVTIVAPNDAPFIIAYARSLDKLKMENGKLKIENKEIHSQFSTFNSQLIKWEFIFVVLFENRGSGFNRKYFVRSVLAQLAAHYNLEFTQLLDYFHSEITLLTSDKSLQAIIVQLYQQEHTIIPLTTTPNPSQLLVIINQQLKQGVNDANREFVLELLSQTAVCHAWLQQLSEDEIIHRLPSLFPNQSTFIIAYAKNLNQLKEERGNRKMEDAISQNFQFSILNFQLIKWQLIFAFLFQNTQSGFNKKYFVEEVIKGIALHYKIELLQLLQFICAHLHNLDNEQEQIFKQLYTKVENKKSAQAVIDTSFNLLQILHPKESLSTESRQILWQHVSQHRLRKESILPLPTEEQHCLVKTLFTHESSFIISFTGYVDSLFKQVLRNKASHFFQSEKWNCIWETLTKNNSSAFDRKQFVMQMLKTIARHYNSNFIELLSYLYTYATDDATVKNILQKLIAEEKQQLIQLVIQTHNTQSIHRLLAAFYPKQREFIWNYARWLIGIFKQETLPAVSKQSFSAFIWKLLFSLLNEYTVLDKYFVQQVLVKIAEQYHSSYLQLFKGNTWNPKTALPQLNRWLKEIQQEQTQETKTKENIQIQEDDFMEETKEPIYINNAGIVLLSPYLPRLFSMLGFVENGKWKEDEEELSYQVRAMFILQYLVFGKTDFPEHEMALNKLLTSVKAGKPIPKSIELTEHEKETTYGLLTSVLQHWEKLKNTSIVGLQEGFLQRNGKLLKTDKGWQLTVEEKAYDMLLDTLPWSFSTIKYSWMEDIMHVKWR